MNPVATLPTTAERDAQSIANALKIRYTPFVLDRGEGPYLFDEEGRHFLDFSAAWALAGLGYSDARVRDAVARQLDKSTFAGLVSSINEPAVELAEALIALVPGDFAKKVWFGLSGSDASEMAQRMILRATGKRRIVSFVGGWHGTTEASMGLSAHPSLADVPGGAHVTKAPYPNPYRSPFGDYAGNDTDQCLYYLENYLFRTICPPDQVAAIFVEAVQSEKYNTSDSSGDIGLVRFAADDQTRKEAKFNGKVWVQSIPIDTAEPKAKPALGKEAYFYGWGRTERDRPSAPLQIGKVMLVPDPACSGSKSEIALCAKGTGQRAATQCHGDSGGPLVLYDKLVPTLIGVVSHNQGAAECGTNPRPGVFTRVAGFRSWIEAHTGKLNAPAIQIKASMLQPEAAPKAN